MFTESSQKISTHLLTVLIIRVILHLEQRKGDQGSVMNFLNKKKLQIRFTTEFKMNFNNHNTDYMNGGMTYDDA